jgi:hypothetical protein
MPKIDAPTGLPMESRDGIHPRQFVIDMIPSGAVCAEIGVWKADFSEKIATHAKPREFHLIDPWAFIPSFPKRWYGGAAASNQKDMDDIHQRVITRMKQFPGITVHRQTSLEAAASFADHHFDWVYVDGDHSYKAAKDDIEAWFPKVKPHGIIAVDDYGWKDEAGTLSVKRAVDEFIKEHDLRKPTVRGNQCILIVP